MAGQDLLIGIGAVLVWSRPGQHSIGETDRLSLPSGVDGIVSTEIG